MSAGNPRTLEKNAMSQVQSFSVSVHRNITFNKGCKKEMPGHEGTKGNDRKRTGHERK